MRRAYVSCGPYSLYSPYELSRFRPESFREWFAAHLECSKPTSISTQPYTNPKTSICQLETYLLPTLNLMPTLNLPHVDLHEVYLSRLCGDDGFLLSTNQAGACGLNDVCSTPLQSLRNTCSFCKAPKQLICCPLPAQNWLNPCLALVPKRLNLGLKGFPKKRCAARVQKICVGKKWLAGGASSLEGPSKPYRACRMLNKHYEKQANPS